MLMNDAVVFGVAIPFWWQSGIGLIADHEKVQNIVDYIAIMNTRQEALFLTPPHKSLSTQNRQA